MTTTLTRTPTCGVANCTALECQPPAPLPADDAAARAVAFASDRRSPMTETERADRLSRWPNPATVNIADFLDACRIEANGRGWCGTAQSMVTQIRLGEAKLHMLARHPQWNDRLDDYDRWAVNPQVVEAGITEVPVADICRTIEYIIGRGYGDDSYMTGMDNILSKVGATYAAAPDVVFKAKVELDVTPTLARRYGFNLTAASSDADVRSVLGQMVRRFIYDGAVTATWTKEDPVAPATT